MLQQPARLPTTLSTVDEAIDSIAPDEQWESETSARHGSQHHHPQQPHHHHRRSSNDYLHSLISPFGRWAGRGIYQPAGVDVEVPENLVFKSRSGLRRGDRSLSAPINILPSMLPSATPTTDDTMASHDTAPNSPPELSYSKSSKSSTSSLHSCSSSLDESSIDKSAQGEDALSERESIEHDSNLRPESRPTLRRPPPRSIVSGDPRAAKPIIASPPSQWPSRDSASPPWRGAVHGVLRDQSLNLPGGMRRGFTSPTVPSFATYRGQRTPSRSPSPSKPINSTNPSTLSPRSATSSTPGRLSTDAFGPLARRQSWQPGKKSVKELEAECNDDDEEVPDDAVLENVPISPMPGQPRRHFSPQVSRSTTPSPHRGQLSPQQPSHANLHSANVPKKAKRPSAPGTSKPRSPRSSRPPMHQHSATFSNFSPDLLNARHRSKSWTEDLNHEARQLSAALEEYADRASTDTSTRSGLTSAANSPPRPSSFQTHRAKSSSSLLDAVASLPAKQRGNVMIDPLPISKEKEAVLTRTRPSWLPPKSQKEEKKHLREWEQMMSRAAESEKKRLRARREAAESNDELQDNLARLWDEHVLPRWNDALREPRTRELWWRGVAPASRGVVWQKAVANDLELSESSFSAALDRAKSLDHEIQSLDPVARAASPEAAWFAAIARDVPVACPAPPSSDPATTSALRHALSDVLMAYTLYRRDVGYVYGTHLIAAPLCQHMAPAAAFIVLANLLNRALPLAFLLHDPAGMSRAHALVLQTLRYKFPSLHAHLTSATLNLPASEFLDPFFRSLGAYHLPPDHLSRVWDLYVFEGDKVLVRVLVAVLGKLEGRLYGGRDEVLDLLGWQREKLWDVALLGSPDDFLAAVREAGKVHASPSPSAATSSVNLPLERGFGGLKGADEEEGVVVYV